VTEEENTKKCTKCKEVKPKGEFSKNMAAKDGLQGTCKACQSAYYEAHKDCPEFDYNETPIPETKICTNCKEKLPGSEFFRSKRCRDGLCSQCKSCSSDSVRKSNAKNKLFYEENKEVLPEVKLCTKCCEHKSISEFSGNVNSKDGLSCHCKACNKRYVTEHKDKIIEYRRIYYSENRAAIIENRKAYYYLHQEQEAFTTRIWRSTNKERRYNYLRSYRLSHLGRFSAREASRRAIKLNATPSWFEKDDIDALYSEADTRSKTEGIKYHVDHIVPLRSKYVCGLHCLDNLQILTRDENLSKGNRYWPGKEWILS
jgi:phosphopantetheinyl transferase (holo-ACP synthase)